MTDATLTSTLLAVAVILGLTAVGGLVARRLGQPAVIGEILTGVALGPSVLGALPGNITARLFPPDVRPALALLAQLGLIFFMFLIGLEVDLGTARRLRRAVGAVSLGAVVVPFSAALVLAPFLYREATSAGGVVVGPQSFAMYIGVALSVTAFPVLARIVQERGMQRTQTGTLALGCAAVTDVVGWFLLMAAVLVGRGRGLLPLLSTFGWLLALGAILMFVVRPAVARWARRTRPAAGPALALALVGACLGAAATTALELHAAFGAFMFGAALPRIAGLVPRIEVGVRALSSLLLPIFFVVAGLSLDLGAVTAVAPWHIVAILAIAVVGKMLGAGLPALGVGLGRREAVSLAVLLNTRGLTELVVLQIGLDRGLIGPGLYTVLVLMALATTMATGPLLGLAERRIRPGPGVRPTERT